MKMKCFLISIVIAAVCLSGCQNTQSSDLAISGELRGRVLRQDGRPVVQAKVTLFEEAKRTPWTIALIGGTPMGEDVTDDSGGFRIAFSSAVQSRLRLTVLGIPETSRRDDGTIVTEGKDVTIKAVGIERENLIVVPDSFVPLRAERKGAEATASADPTPDL